MPTLPNVCRARGVKMSGGLRHDGSAHIRMVEKNGVPMKTVFPLLLSLVLCSLAHGAVCPSGQPKNEAALVQVEHEWLRAIEQHDAAALGCILADEFEEADFAGWS